MSFLEKKIKENAVFFDDRELPEGHQKRFIEKLNQKRQTQVKSPLIYSLYKVAAALLILIATAWMFLVKDQIIHFASEKGSQAIFNVINIELPDELNTTFAFYDSNSADDLSKIDELAPNEQEAEKIKKLAGDKLQSIDAELAAIEKEYMTNPGSKQLEAALINSKRKKSEIMETILNQLNNVQQTNQAAF
ncbi:MAG TPA: hypothetical protein PLI65_04960 [Bacteroidales bacterium]|nr:hypothetical protein [Bacteroidales bacterium]HPR57375.1 hypothetical protein [Bacteroidales bacterium]HRW96112.1 hypothetical protein [Bacteroidales bacterium]